MWKWAIRAGCLVLAAVGLYIAVLAVGAHRRSPFVLHPVSSVEELWELTGLSLPPETELVEAAWEMLPGETFVWATLTLPRPDAEALLDSPPFGGIGDDAGQFLLEYASHPPSSRRLRHWRPREASASIERTGHYEAPRPGAESTGSEDEKVYSCSVYAYADLDDPLTANVYLFWMVELDWRPAETPTDD